jgi:hypothetical protein
MDRNHNMRIAFNWYFDKAEQIYPNWRDGLRAAMELIGKKHQVDWIMGKKFPDPTIDYDFLLFWDDSNSDVFRHLNDYKCPKGICLTTNPTFMDNLRMLDVVYCESDPIYNSVRASGIRAIKAFGTDTDFFTPDPTLKRDIEYFYPATFSPWKLQSQLAYLGNKLVCIGTVQPDGYGELEACKKAGVTIMEGYYPVETIRSYYRRAKNVIIPAIHGSERTVLEAMSCGVFPIVTNEGNVRTRSYIEEYIKAKTEDPGLRPREFVVKNYSHVKYAEDLLRGIEQ